MTTTDSYQVARDAKAEGETVTLTAGGWKIDRRGTLEMKLTRARAAATYARLKSDRDHAAAAVTRLERELAACILDEHGPDANHRRSLNGGRQ